MTDPIFCQTRFNYRDPFHPNPDQRFGSYHDFFRLVELSGFPLIYVDEIDPASDNTYIFAPRNGEVGEGWPGARARIIHWNLEQDGYPPLAGVAETWVSDARLAELTGAKYVMMGSHPGLASELFPKPKMYDVIMLSYMTPRRGRIQNELTQRDIAIAPNGWGLERHSALLASAAMLQVHQNDGKPYVAPQRFALAAAYHLPVITETLGHRNGFGAGHLLMSDFDYLADFVQMWTRRNEARVLEDYGHALHQLLCVQHVFRKEIEAAL